MAQAAAASADGRARGRHDALRHRRRARRRLLRRAARALRRRGRCRCASATPGLILHAANSAALLRDADSHFDLVRAGVAIYGLDPFQEDAGARDLEPALGAGQLRRRDQALRGRRERGLRPALRRRGGHRARHRADRVRRRGEPRADQQRRGARRRHGASRSSARCRWTTSPSTSAPTAPACRHGDEALLIGDGPPGRGDGAAAGDHQLRGHVRSDGARAARAPPRRGAAVIEMLREALAGERAWLVGGALRDRLLGRPTPDLDVVVDGDVRRAARSLGRGAGGASFELSDQFGAWRVVARDRSWQVDITPLQGGSLEADLAARDLTVNAMAEPLAGGELVDPHGGAERPRAQAPAHGQRRGVRGRSAAHAARRAPGHRARLRDRSRHRGRGPRARARAGRHRAGARLHRAAPHRQRRRGRARPRAHGRARPRRRGPARAHARCAASSRTPTTTATSTATRSRSCRRASTSSAIRPPRSATRRWPRPCARCSPSRWPTS